MRPLRRVHRARKLHEPGFPLLLAVPAAAVMFWVLLIVSCNDGVAVSVDRDHKFDAVDVPVFAPTFDM